MLGVDNPTLTIAEVPLDDPALQRCFARYYAELAERFDGGFDPSSAAYSGAGDAAESRAVLAWISDQVIGCGMAREIEPGLIEVKRVWLDPDVRGRGVAAAMMDRLEEIARDMGARLLRLDTNRSLTEARSFYLKRGYREISRYNDNPYADFWFEKAL